MASEMKITFETELTPFPTRGLDNGHFGVSKMTLPTMLRKFFMVTVKH